VVQRRVNKEMCTVPVALNGVQIFNTQIWKVVSPAYKYWVIYILFI
jgi:hypothetical protein